MDIGREAPSVGNDANNGRDLEKVTRGTALDNWRIQYLLKSIVLETSQKIEPLCLAARLVIGHQSFHEFNTLAGMDVSLCFPTGEQLSLLFPCLWPLRKIFIKRRYICDVLKACPPISEAPKHW